MTQQSMSQQPGWPAALQASLIELIDLSLQAKHAHWNVSGPGFKPVHEFFDELTDAYRSWSDEIAERLVTTGVPADGRVATAASSTPLPPIAAGWLSVDAALLAMAERVTTVAGNIRERAESLGDSDLVSQGLCLEIVLGLEKQRWMLRAHAPSASQ